MERTHYGVHKELEAAADEWLRQAVAELPRSQKMDILTPWKERDRLSREVYTSEGVPDPAVRSGMYNRAWNPGSSHLNSRDGHTRGHRTHEVFAYWADESYQDRAGRVYAGPVRMQSACRRVSWGRIVRLQCPPCRRYLASGDEITCRRCGTIYVKDGGLADVC
jgi:hypothetical protein